MELILFSIIFILLFLIIPVFAYFYGKTCAYREMVEAEQNAALETLRKRLYEMSKDNEVNEG